MIDPLRKIRTNSTSIDADEFPITKRILPGINNINNNSILESDDGTGRTSNGNNVSGEQQANNTFYNCIAGAPDIPERGKTVPLGLDMGLSLGKRSAGVPSAIERHNLNDEELRTHVYKKTLQALIYPISLTTPHDFEFCSFTYPTYCYDCEGLLWGIARQGLKCRECGLKCHEKCKDLFNADCLQLISAQGLIAKDKTGTSDPDEDDDIQAKLMQKLTHESDDFLGQTIIELRTLSGETDVWYNLEKRTDKSTVSGAIRLHISVEIKGEEKVAPYRAQYSCLHENLFYTLCENNNGQPVIPDAKGDDAWKVYFDEPSQEIVNEFAIRYGIESIYQAMTHFACLSTKYMCSGVPAVMSTLLANINAHYARTIATTAANQFGASNFGIQGLSSPPRASTVVKDCVKNCISYTYNFLFANCDEVYKRESKQQTNPTENHHELNDDGTQISSIDKTTTHGVGSSLKSLQFWHKLIYLLTCIISEDRERYSLVLNQFSSELNVGHISADTLWNLLSADLKDELQEHDRIPAERSAMKSDDYMTLHFTVKEFYDTSVKIIPEAKNTVPEYPKWFEPFVIRWLNENGDMSMEYLHNALEKDRQTGFQQTSEHCLFSSSVVDVFTPLNEYYRIIKTLEIHDSLVIEKYMQHFSVIISQVLLGYANGICRTFEQVAGQDNICSILMNNIQRSRFHLDQLYEVMGGAQLDNETKSRLNELQKQLSDVLDELSAMFVKSIEPTIRQTIEEVNKQLQQIKENQMNPGNNSGQQKGVEASLVMKSLLDYLYQIWTFFDNQCEKTIRKRLLKELWKVVISDLEKVIVLPPISDSNHRLTIPSAKIEDAYRLLSGELDRDNDRNLTQNQCQILDHGLEDLKEFFQASGQGLKKDYLEKTTELQSLKYALSLYTQTTDSLIKTFVKTEKEQDRPALEESFGEVSIEVDLFTDAGSGEHKVTVKGTKKIVSMHCSYVFLLNLVVAANGLKWRTTRMFCPYVELAMCGPHLSDKKHKYTTKMKSNTWIPKYNETFHFLLGNEEEPDCYELNVAVKDYSFMREDRLIGLNVIKLKQVCEQDSWSSWIPLGARINFDDAGLTILRILSHRTNDELARQFVALKSARRHKEDV
ncbi:unnamed protein product [Rotaria sp. Silwood1]|nr:unnamed protein product [Rotaria sp. Silwood1]